MTTHELKLAAEPFEAIKDGSKVIESRLFDEKRQLIGPGDEIIFTNRENPGESLQVKVIGLLRYPNFKMLFSDNDTKKFGGSSVDWLLRQISEFYSEEEQQRFGVVGIRFELL